MFGPELAADAAPARRHAASLSKPALAGVTISALRPRQWLKNLLVAAPLVFSGRLLQADADLRTISAIVIFCALASGGYLVNDVLDRQSDARHPLKRFRALASGRLTIREALVAASVLEAAALVASLLMGAGFLAVALLYVILTLAYSVRLKVLWGLDILAIVAAFILRSMGGAAAIRVPISPWLYVLTASAALLLILGKRRAEACRGESRPWPAHRRFRSYDPRGLDVAISFTILANLGLYAAYAVAAESLPRDHAMLFTVPVVGCGLLRYGRLTRAGTETAAPEELLIRDLPLLGVVVLWLVVSLAVLYVLK